VVQDSPHLSRVRGRESGAEVKEAAEEAGEVHPSKCG
jgi:hypothetical protein